MKRRGAAERKKLRDMIADRGTPRTTLRPYKRFGSASKFEVVTSERITPRVLTTFQVFEVATQSISVEEAVSRLEALIFYSETQRCIKKQHG